MADMCCPMLITQTINLKSHGNKSFSSILIRSIDIRNDY